ncbi:hypothetical protein ACFQBQ_03865 [Granulicella cerasi]|uniref:Uncharacterized protein n=1 Tax=Granulicella cerasi TaxID=741063 RepID=A0ABW1Z5P5_9BACT
MSSTSLPFGNPMTSEEVVQITKDTNYGTWRYQRAGRRCISSTPKAAT